MPSARLGVASAGPHQANGVAAVADHQPLVAVMTLRRQAVTNMMVRMTQRGSR
jgi:hypothetical protein